MEGTEGTIVDTRVDAAELALPTSKRGWLIVGAILGLALFLRLVVAAEVARDYTPLTDAAHYDLIAASLASGDGYGDAALPLMEGPSAFRAPLYPATLAVVYKVFGNHSYTWGLVANAFIGVGAVAAIGWLASLLWNRRIGAVALAIAAIHPSLSLIGSSLQHEPLLALLTVAAVAAAIQHGRSDKRWQWAVVTGVLIGLAGLTRELGLLAAPPIAVLLWQHRPTGTSWLSAKALRAPVIAAVVAVTMIAPWTIRNMVQLDEFVPVSTSSGFGLSGAFNDTSVATAEDSWTSNAWIVPYDDPEVLAIIEGLETPTETAIDSALREHALEVLGDNPDYLVKLVLGNALRITDLDGGDYSLDVMSPYVPYPKWLTLLSIAAGLAILVVAAYGATRRLVRSSPMAVWAIPIITLAFILLLLPASIRYRGGSLEPFLVLLAAVAVTDIADRTGLTRRLQRLSAARSTTIEES